MQSVTEYVRAARFFSHEMINLNLGNFLPELQSALLLPCCVFEESDLLILDHSYCV